MFDPAYDDPGDSTLTVDEYKRDAAAAMLERGRDGLQQQVMDRLKAHGWLAYHTFDSRKSAPGFPDIVAISEPYDGPWARQIVIELKREGAWPSTDQQQWLDAFSGAEVHTYLWFPSDLIAGTVDYVLQGGY